MYYDYKMSEALSDALFEARKAVAEARERQQYVEQFGAYAKEIAKVLNRLLDDAQSYDYGEGFAYKDIEEAVRLIEAEYASGMAQVKKMMETRKQEEES